MMEIWLIRAAAERLNRDHSEFLHFRISELKGKKMDRLIDCFVTTFGINRDQITPKLAYQSIPEWDSVGHMALVAEIECTFDIRLDTDDIIGMSDVARAIQIVQKHGVVLNEPALAKSR
jgi:acyl carrier protein